MCKACHAAEPDIGYGASRAFEEGVRRGVLCQGCTRCEFDAAGSRGGSSEDQTRAGPRESESGSSGGADVPRCRGDEEKRGTWAHRPE